MADTAPHGQEPTCSSCVHFHRLSAADMKGAVVVDGTEKGHCRERLHSQAFVGPKGQVAFATYYPELAGANLTCGQYQKREG